MTSIATYTVPTAFVNVPADTQEQFDAIGPCWAQDLPGHIAYVVDAYTQLARHAPKDGVVVTRDIAYGPHARHKLDIFAPQGAHATDVVVFVHGGAFVRGDKNVTPELYDNVGYWFARQGVTAVNLEYRLAGDAPHPSGAQDVAAAVQYLGQHVEAAGGNPRRIFLMGHSAGGTHVATYCCDPEFADSFDAKHVAGAILVSARLRADALPDNPNAYAVRAYYGEDAASYEQYSPVTHAADFRIPVMIAIAQYENPHLDAYGVEMLLQVLRARQRPHRFMQLMRHNHLSIVAHFNSGEEQLGREILAFMEGTPPSP